ncbi:glutamate synthase [Longispora fulva]|uniref:Glutamate synthase (NADPH/NADH) small chain n=1 Tax=Longispora fulva TaxID=619741 RepID=A0A8J7GIG1_9ACTN|nr:glutamate synthase subunit beta [Longispora fulva]MBG6141243.1 glutamate synthase (NADPH/NADH) small chain [Longispora fulva]GIG62761.1 glutamate synthase [Longispora fulva]
MPDPKGFLTHGRQTAPRRPVPVRISDWREVYLPASDELLKNQASRCMDCGIPFCHDGCPLGNRIPDWNDLVRTGRYDAAAEQLYATNNFPEFTGRLCPAPCEAACVLGIASDAVTIKQVEQAIGDRASLAPGVVAPATGRRIAVVGSGPAGLAAAQQLVRAGHAVTVFERDDAPGGLLRYGIPDFKLEKTVLDARLDQLRLEGVVFECGVNVTDLAALRESFDAVLLAVGALAGREVDTPGRHLAGVHQAMEHLVEANRWIAFGEQPVIDAAGKHVVIIGGGDTAADCLGVAHRQGAASVTQLDRYPVPPTSRDGDRDPWPTWPWLLRDYAAHEEGGERAFGVAVSEFEGADGQVTGVRIDEVTVVNRVATPVPGTSRVLPADLVLLAIGFAGTDSPLGLAEGGRFPAGDDWQTGTDGVFVAGDAHRGASLIVWAIAEGRAAASAIHSYLGGTGALPAPVRPTSAALTV